MSHKNLLSHLMDPESVDGLQEVMCYIPGGEWGVTPSVSMIVLTGSQEMPARVRNWDKVMRGEEERLEEICLICWR